MSCYLNFKWVGTRSFKCSQIENIDDTLEKLFHHQFFDFSDTVLHSRHTLLIAFEFSLRYGSSNFIQVNINSIRFHLKIMNFPDV